MIQKKRVQVKIIACDSAHRFEEALNRALDEVTDSRYTYDVQFSANNDYYARIVYEEVVNIAESIEDRFKLKGIQCYCEECEHFIPSYDGRVKYFRCPVADRNVKRTSNCCDEFYRILEMREKNA